MPWFKTREQRFIEKHVDNYLSSVKPEQLSDNVARALAASVMARAKKELGYLRMTDPSGYALAHIAKRLNRQHLFDEAMRYRP
jgi:hypothetical protein